MKKNYQLACMICLMMVSNLFGQIPNTLSKGEKVYGLSKFWQEVNYNFIYLNKVDRKKWDSTYVSFIDAVQQTKNDYEYYRILQQFCALLNDGHTNIYFPEKIERLFMTKMFGDYMLNIENIEHKPIITQVNLSKKEIIPPGSEILEVNGVPVKVYMQEVIMPFISSSTAHVLEDMATQDLLKGFEGDSYRLKIRKTDGAVISITLTHRLSTEKEWYPEIDRKKNLLDFKWLDHKIAYVALNSFQYAKIDSLFLATLPQMYTAKGLIIDLRKNEGGNGAYGLEILKYLIPDTTVRGAKSQTRNHIATYKAWGEMVNVNDTALNADYKNAYLSYTDQYYFNFPNTPKKIETSYPRLIVPTIVLIGHNTASAAEDFLIYADGQKHFTKVGRHTVGSTGQPFYFLLPGAAQARVCTKRDTYPDGKEFVGKGILPDVFVEPTLKDYLDKRDVEMEKAIELLLPKIGHQ